MGVSKFIYDGEVKFDLTADTAIPSTVLKGFTFHGADGEAKEGTCLFDVNSSGATATSAEVLHGKTFAARGGIHTGTMNSFEGQQELIETVDQVYHPPRGYHDGSGAVRISLIEQEKIIPANIRQGVEILGVIGSMSATEGAKAQAITVTPKGASQVILPGQGYNYISQVTVEGIPYSEMENAAGGITITVG